jgi:hypothetical protein
MNVLTIITGGFRLAALAPKGASDRRRGSFGAGRGVPRPFAPLRRDFEQNPLKLVGTAEESRGVLSGLGVRQALFGRDELWVFGRHAVNGCRSGGSGWRAALVSTTRRSMDRRDKPGDASNFIPGGSCGSCGFGKV